MKIRNRILDSSFTNNPNSLNKQPMLYDLGSPFLLLQLQYNCVIISLGGVVCFDDSCLFDGIC